MILFHQDPWLLFYFFLLCIIFSFCLTWDPWRIPQWFDHQFSPRGTSGTRLLFSKQCLLNNGTLESAYQGSLFSVMRQWFSAPIDSLSSTPPIASSFIDSQFAPESFFIFINTYYGYTFTNRMLENFLIYVF